MPFNGICFSQNDHSKGKKIDKEFLTLKQDVQRKTAVYFFLRLFYFIGLFSSLSWYDLMDRKIRSATGPLLLVFGHRTSRFTEFEVITIFDRLYFQKSEARCR